MVEKKKMYPGYWGSWFWLYLHSLSLYWMGLQDGFPVEIWSEYLSLMCIFLPCPQCSVHCRAKQQKRPKLLNGKMLFEYLVDFHNEVNVSQKEVFQMERYVYGYDEAERAIKRNMEMHEFGGTEGMLDSLGFWFHFFLVLYFFSITFDTLVTQFESASWEEFPLYDKFRRLMLLHCKIVPGERARILELDIMGADLSSLDKVEHFIGKAFFGFDPSSDLWTEEEWKKKMSLFRSHAMKEPRSGETLEEFYDRMMDWNQCDQNRRQSDFIMNELQDELQQHRGVRDGYKAQYRTADQVMRDVDSDWEITAIVFIILFCLLLVLDISYWIYVRYNYKCVSVRKK